MMAQNLIKTALTAVFLIVVGSTNIYSSTPQSTMKIPDFAFPKDVAASSRAELDLALEKGQPVKALRQLMNLTIAESMISKENAFANIQLIDSVANALPSPYNAIGYLIEAQLFSEIYNADRWTYDNRTVAPNLDDANPEFWDKSIFKSRIEQLLEKALLSKDLSSKESLLTINSLVTYFTWEHSFTIYDFIVYKTIELRRIFGNDQAVIPFYKETENPGRDNIRLIDQLIELHSKPSYALVCALSRKAELLPQKERADYLWKEIEKLKDNENVCLLIPTFYYIYQQPLEGESKLPDAKELYVFLKELSRKFKSATGKYISGVIQNMEQTSVDIVYPSLIKTDSDFEVKTTSRNCGKYFVILAQYSDKLNGGVTPQILSRYAPVVSCAEVLFSDSVPFEADTTLNFRVAKPGKYFLAVSKTKDLRDVILDTEKFYPRVIEASDIDVISVNEILKGANFRNNDVEEKILAGGCFVVDTSTGAPIEGAKITFASNRVNGRWQRTPVKEYYTSDSEGFAETTLEPMVKADVTYRNSLANTTIYDSRFNPENRSGVKIMTDRSVYRPGDEVEFFGIFYRSKDNVGSLAANDSVSVELRDANHQLLETRHLKTDESGRFFGSYLIPDDGLLGNWSIICEDSRYGFQVAEYKTPSLLVTLEKTASAPNYIEFKGKAATFSGMPVADTKVNFNVHYQPFRFWYSNNSNEAFYASSVTTDSQGEFRISLPRKNLKPENYRGFFDISASVTDQAGETAQSNSVGFVLKESYTLNPEFGERICVNGDSVDFIVKVLDSASLPAIKEVKYDIRDSEDKIVAEGKFESPRLSIPTDKLPSGKYSIHMSLPGEDTPEVSESFTVFRTSDLIPPVESTLWIPLSEIKMKEGETEAEVIYGSSFSDQKILCFITDTEGNCERFWLDPKGTNRKIKTEAPKPNARKYVTFCTYRNHEFSSETVEIIPFQQTRQLEIKTETFRSSLTPGENESWKFKLTYAGQPSEGYAYALLYDKALDSVYPYYWNPVFYRPVYPQFLSLNGNSAWKNSALFHYPNKATPSIEPPVFRFETFGYSLFGSRNFAIQFSRGVSKNYARSMAIEECADEMEVPMMKASAAGFAEDSVVAVETAMEGEGEVPQDKEFRPIELPVAFFKPDLQTSDTGEMEIDFTVPNFNTTWKFLLGAYTSDLKCAGLNLEAVASKKVMVRMLPPRFLRSGDKAVITATIYNNSDKEEQLTGEFEIFDPVSGETLTVVKTASVSVRPSGSHVVSMDFECPVYANALGIRAYAKSHNSSDGEQTVIPVLPASQPIIETDPFYLAPGEIEFTMEMPSLKKDSKVTFTYNDNPTWGLLTALTPIVNPETESVITLTNGLYANCVGYGLLQKNQNLSKALSMMLRGEAGDSTLISNLEKNSDLKTVTLNNTPWVNNAKSQTLRMSQLGFLLETASATDAINSIWTRISKLRNSDTGAWSWRPGMEPSRWITEGVLLNLGMLAKNGYLPPLSDNKKLIEKALRYCEDEYINDFKKTSVANHKSFYQGMKYFLYVLSFYPDHKCSVAFANLKSKALVSLENDWKENDLFWKATMAITFKREGKAQTARTIMESVRQFASESKGKGVWFDNLDSSWGGANKLLTTTRILSAFHEISPSDPIIDKIRQWVLLQSQTLDISENIFSVDVIDAMLTSGTEWTGDYPTPEITIGRKEIPSTEIAKLTGECRIDLNLTDEGNKLISIRRFSPTPAWGGVINQFVAPMEKVNADAIEGLSIEKEFWKIIDSEEGEKAVKTDRLSVGDKVRVTLIVDSQRDMDFVALTDERPACLEPIDQISGYDVTDGLWCYHETRNSATNMFFGFLPRGRHIISYECRVMEAGEFASGIATLQSQYAPAITAHSSGMIVKVKGQ